MVLVILLQILPHKLKIIKTTKKIILKKKNKVMTLVVLVILLQILPHKFKIIISKFSSNVRLIYKRKRSQRCMTHKVDSWDNSSIQILSKPQIFKIIKTTKKIILKKKNKVMTLVVLVILLQILTHKFKIIKTTKKIILKKKNKVMTLETY